MRPKDSLVPIVADMKIKEHIPKHFQKKDSCYRAAENR